MEQICNLVYYTLTEHSTTAQKAELDVALSDPKDREKMLERQNAIAMQQLMSQGGSSGMIVPPRPKGQPVGEAHKS